MFQFVDRIFIFAFGGCYFKQARLFRHCSQTAFEISAGGSGCASLHFSDSRQEVSVRSGASIVVQLNFSELHLVDTVALQNAVAQCNQLCAARPGRASRRDVLDWRRSGQVRGE